MIATPATAFGRGGRTDRIVCVGIPGGFDESRQLLGEKALCIAFYDQPELIHDILHTIGDTAFRVLERESKDVQIDLLSPTNR